MWYIIFINIFVCRCTVSAHQAIIETMKSDRCSGYVSYELANTFWTSTKDMNAADWWRNNNQLETDVAECRGAWTWSMSTLLCTRHMVESRRNGPQPSTRYIHLYSSEKLIAQKKKWWWCWTGSKPGASIHTAFPLFTLRCMKLNIIYERPLLRSRLTLVILRILLSHFLCIYTECGKKEANSFLWITLTNVDAVS